MVLLGTLDTKGAEYAYLRDRVRDEDVDVFLIDAGILGEPSIEADVTRQEVAAAAGADVGELADTRDRASAIEAMGRGAAVIARRLHTEGRLDAIGALGGTGGTAIATRAMRALQVGVPKLMVSTVASGETSGYVGTSDLAESTKGDDFNRTFTSPSSAQFAALSQAQQNRQLDCGFRP